MEKATLDVVPEPEPQEAELERLARSWRVLQLVPDDTAPPLWREVGTAESDPRWTSLPPAGEIGKRWGEGEYLLIRCAEHYAIRSMRVVAETEYREASDDEEPAAAA